MFRVCVVVLLASTMANSGPVKPHYDLQNAPQLFEDFIKDYGKVYKDAADRARHYEAFVKKLEVINKANAGSSSATFDINKFADYTAEDSKHLTGVLQPQLNHSKTKE